MGHISQGRRFSVTLTKMVIFRKKKYDDLLPEGNQ